MLTETRFSSKKDSFADLISTIVVLARGKRVDNAPCWAYVALKPSMALSFKEACAQGNLDLEQYGTVLEHGEGVEPSETIKERMQRDFGVQPDFEDRLKDAIKQFS